MTQNLYPPMALLKKTAQQYPKSMGTYGKFPCREWYEWATNMAGLVLCTDVCGGSNCQWWT